MEYPIEMSILLMHNLHLLLLFKLIVRIALTLTLANRKGARVRQVAITATAYGTGYVLVELLAHVLDLRADFLDESLPAGSLMVGDAELRWVGFDSLDGGDEVGEVLCQG
jgi:hypothetical protein